MNRIVALAGGSSGIGAATIDRMLLAGCEIVNLDRVKTGRADIREIDCDLADPESIERAVSKLPARLDAVVNVAGVAPGLVPDETVVAVNFLGMREFLTLVVDRVRDAGSIVIVASSAGRDWREQPGVTELLDTSAFDEARRWLADHGEIWRDNPYRFSKQCAAAFTYRAAGLAWGRGVRVNCVNPGIVETALSPRFRDMLGAERYDRIVAESGRAGRPEDVAAVVEFLVLGDCEWLNGVEITVDGGYYAGVVGGWIDAR